MLSSSDLAAAEEFVETARTLGDSSEMVIAESFIDAAKGDYSGALTKLAHLDSPSARAAGLSVVARINGNAAAVEWLRVADVRPENLDADGLLLLLSMELVLAHWDSAAEVARMVGDDDLAAAPALRHQVGIAVLLTTVPVDYRQIVRDQLPLDLSGFPFDSDGDAVEALRVARDHFYEAFIIEKQLKLVETAKLDEEYAVWLDLKDIDACDDARRRLEVRLRDGESALHLVPHGIQFGIKIDFEAVETAIERTEALNGRITSDTATARFSLALTEGYSEEHAEFIRQHSGELAKYLSTNAMRIVQLERFLSVGRYEEAYKCVDLFQQEGIPASDVARFRERIDEIRGADLVEVRRTRFENSDRFDDLVALVSDLKERELWDGLCRYGSILFERTRSVIHATWLVSALANSHRMAEVAEFLKSHPRLLEQSSGLQLADAWSSYYGGQLLKARSILSSKGTDWEYGSYRALSIRLAITLGDWHSLMECVANEYVHRDRLSATELLGAAQLGYSVDSPHTRALLDAAVEKGNDAAEVLAGAYSLAVQADLESEVSVEWVQRAAALSDEEGPVRKIDIRGVVDVHTQWETRANGVWRLLRVGDCPICVAAQFLNTSLVQMTLISAVQDLDETDPRRRRVIPAYSGRRIPRRIENARSVCYGLHRVAHAGVLGRSGHRS